MILLRDSRDNQGILHFDAHQKHLKILPKYTPDPTPLGMGPSGSALQTGGGSSQSSSLGALCLPSPYLQIVGSDFRLVLEMMDLVSNTIWCIQLLLEYMILSMSNFTIFFRVY